MVLLAGLVVPRVDGPVQRRLGAIHPDVNEEEEPDEEEPDEEECEEDDDKLEELLPLLSGFRNSILN